LELLYPCNAISSKPAFQSPYFRVFIWNPCWTKKYPHPRATFSPLTFGSLFGTFTANTASWTRQSSFSPLTFYYSPVNILLVYLNPGPDNLLSVPLLSGLYLERRPKYSPSFARSAFQSPYFRVFIWNALLSSLFCTYSGLSVPLLSGLYLEPDKSIDMILCDLPYFQSPYFRVFIWNPGRGLLLDHRQGHLSVPLLSGLYLERKIEEKGKEEEEITFSPLTFGSLFGTHNNSRTSI
jgi:hypothetical protein